VDQRLGDSEYHFSWRHDGSKTYTWDGANQYCGNLGSGWQGISIETRQEDSLVREAITEGNISSSSSLLFCAIHTQTFKGRGSSPRSYEYAALLNRAFLSF